MASCSRKPRLDTQGSRYFQQGHLRLCTYWGWQVGHGTCRRPTSFWPCMTLVALPRGKWQPACTQAPELSLLSKQGKKHWNSSVFIKSLIRGVPSAWIKHYTTLQQHWEGVPVCAATQAPKIKPGESTNNLCKAQVQRSAQQGWLRGARVEAKEGNRTRAAIGAIDLHPHILPALPSLDAGLPNLLLTQSVELARDRIDPRSCFWVTLTKNAIMHTSFHIYAKSIHPTHISTVF